MLYFVIAFIQLLAEFAFYHPLVKVGQRRDFKLPYDLQFHLISIQ